MSKISLSSSEDAFKFLVKYCSSSTFYWYAYWYVYCVNLFGNWPTLKSPPGGSSSTEVLKPPTTPNSYHHSSTTFAKDPPQNIPLSSSVSFSPEDGVVLDPPSKLVVSEKGGGPARTKRKKTGKDKIEAVIQETYPAIVREVYSGKSLNKAVVRAGISRTSFFKWRYMAEMRIVDAAHYQALQRQFCRSSQKLSEECRRCVAERGSPFFQLAEQLRADKRLLPLVYSFFCSRHV